MMETFLSNMTSDSKQNRCHECGGMLPYESVSGCAALMCSCNQQPAGSPSISNWEQEWDAKFYSKTDQTCTWHRNTDIKIFIRSLLSTAKEEAKVQERFRAVEILHKYFMEATHIPTMNVLEAAQKEILC